MPSSWESSRSGSVGDGPEAPGTCGVVALPPGGPPFRILHISGTSLVHGRRGDTYVVYHIRVACAGAFPSAWTCYRRYAEFDAVYGALRADGVPCAAPPGKRLFGNLSASFLAERAVLLERWLRELAPEALASEPGPSRAPPRRRGTRRPSPRRPRPRPRRGASSRAEPRGF